jgi:hypothetical protein
MSIMIDDISLPVECVSKGCMSWRSTCKALWRRCDRRQADVVDGVVAE